MAGTLLGAVLILPSFGGAAAQAAPAFQCGVAASICRHHPTNAAKQTGESAATGKTSPDSRDDSGDREGVLVDPPEPRIGAAFSSRVPAMEVALPVAIVQAESFGAFGRQAKQNDGNTGATGAQQQDKTASRKHPTGNHEPSATSGSPGHIFWVIPAYKVNYSGQFQPLTSREKFQEWWESEYDPLGLGATVVEAGTLEYSSKDGFCGYGPTFTNYMQCFGSLELDASDSSFLGDYVFTVWWHQDPRYFRLGTGSFGKRSLYAISRVFITYDDSGKNVIYSSGLAGTGIAAVLSNLYYPKSDRTVGHTFSRVAIDLGDTALYNGAAEFWPGIHRFFNRVF